jgi:hypothetical protein
MKQISSSIDAVAQPGSRVFGSYLDISIYFAAGGIQDCG